MPKPSARTPTVRRDTSTRGARRPTPRPGSGSRATAPKRADQPRVGEAAPAELLAQREHDQRGDQSPACRADRTTASGGRRSRRTARSRRRGRRARRRAPAGSTPGSSRQRPNTWPSWRRGPATASAASSGPNALRPAHGDRERRRRPALHPGQRRRQREQPGRCAREREEGGGSAGVGRRRRCAGRLHPPTDTARGRRFPRW